MPAPSSDPILTANKTTVRRLFNEAWNEADFSHVAADLASDARFTFRGRTRVTNAGDLRDLVTAWRHAFPDLRFQIHDIVAEGDLVAVRLSFSGTHRGPWKEIPATGRTVTVTQMMFFRLEHGRVVELWEDFDEFGLRQQLGAAG